MSDSVLPIFSSRNFIVSGLTFRYLIHVEFIKCVLLSTIHKNRLTNFPILYIEHEHVKMNFDKAFNESIQSASYCKDLKIHFGVYKSLVFLFFFFPRQNFYFN